MVFGTFLITGAGLVLLGFLVKKYPDLIAGYNTMSKREKAKVDIDGLSSMMRNALIILGVLVALAYPLMSLLVLKEHAAGAIITILLFGCFIMVIYAQKFKTPRNGSGKKSNKKFLIIGIVFSVLAFAIFGLFYYGLDTPEVDINKKHLNISGMYSISEEVESIDVVDALPKILSRTNGFSYGNTHKGNYRTQDNGIVKLYLGSKTVPYIQIKTTDGQLIYLNTKTTAETEQLLLKLRSQLK